MAILSDDALRRALEGVPGWSVAKDGLTRTFRFASFGEAITFVNRTAEIAEELVHHPDLDIRYDKVRVAVTTHDAGGLTELDFRLASRLDQCADIA